MLLPPQGKEEGRDQTLAKRLQCAEALVTKDSRHKAIWTNPHPQRRCDVIAKDVSKMILTHQQPLYPRDQPGQELDQVPNMLPESGL